MQGVEIGQIGFVELNLVQHIGQIFALAGGEIIQSSTFSPCASKLPGQGGPDETRNAGDEISRHRISIIQFRFGTLESAQDPTCHYRARLRQDPR